MIYTTNATASVNGGLRKVLKTRGARPSDESVTKLLYRAILRLSQTWTRPITNGPSARNPFALEFEGRVSLL